MPRTKFLTIIENQLKITGYKFTRIDGSMTPKARDSAVQALQDDPECRILLASLAVCSVGLNLVAADTVILSDSCEFFLILQGGLYVTNVRRVVGCYRRSGG